MKYMKLTQEERDQHPSIHRTGSVRGMKRHGGWGKDDVCVLCGQYIYNLSMFVSPHSALVPGRSRFAGE